MYSLVRMITSSYWVVRDLLRSKFVWFLWVIILVVYVLSNVSVGAIDLNSIAWGGSYSHGAYQDVRDWYWLPSSASPAQYVGSSRAPVFVDSHIWRKEIFFPFGDPSWAVKNNFSITNNSWIFKFLFKGKWTSFNYLVDSGLWYVLSEFGMSNIYSAGFSLVFWYDKDNTNTPVYSIVGDKIYKNIIPFYSNWYGTIEFFGIFDRNERKLYKYNFNSSLADTFSNYNLLENLSYQSPVGYYDDVVMTFNDFNCWDIWLSQWSFNGIWLRFCYSSYYSTSDKYSISPDFVFDPFASEGWDWSSSFFTGDLVSFTWSTTTQQNKEQVRIANINRCIDYTMSIRNDFDLRADVKACQSASSGNVALGGDNVYDYLFQRYSAIYNWSGVWTIQRWDFNVATWSNVIDVCSAMNANASALMVATRPDVWRVNTSQRIGFVTLADMLTYSTLGQVSPSLTSDDAFSLCVSLVDQITAEYESIGSWSSLWWKISARLDEKPNTDNRIDKVGWFFQNLWLGIGKIYDWIIGTNKSIDDLSSILSWKDFWSSLSWVIIDASSSLSWLVVNVPDNSSFFSNIFDWDNIISKFKNSLNATWLSTSILWMVGVSTWDVAPYIPNMCVPQSSSKEFANYLFIWIFVFAGLFIIRKML